MATKVTCTPPKGKKGYTINFRHPVEKDKSGKYGLKVHRGLSTADEKKANILVAQLENMIADEYWWNRSKRNEAYNHFDTIVVDAFFDPMDTLQDECALLDKIMLPGKAEGYKRGLLLGPSGVGKTSLLRIMAGTVKEKFPTTSTGRTTTCNMEIIMSDERDYEMVITFMSRHLVEMYVQECIEAAIDVCMHTDGEQSRQAISESLFIHRDLVVRLSYLLGDLTLTPETGNEDFEDDFDEDIINNTEKEDTIYSQDSNMLLQKVNYFIDELIKICDTLKSGDVDVEDESFNPEDNIPILALRDEMVNEIAKRFDLLTNGERLNSKGKWVNAWYFKTSDRKEFLKMAKLFSSNSKGSWGGLLTPIVKTMRVKGDFRPAAMDQSPKIVLFDGLGLGHKTTATSLPNRIVEYFRLSDAIILVDNAQAPVLDNVKMALKAVIEYGYASKILFAFTHVDMMKGDNFHKFDDKRRHILAALNSYLHEMKRQNEDTFSDAEAKSIINSCHFFSDLDKDEPSKMTQHYTQSLLKQIENLYSAGITIEDVMLKYDAMTLYSHVQAGIRKYRDIWSQIIGYPVKTEKTTHWSRVKALTRRLAYFGQDHYHNELMPLADFRQELSSQLNLFLNKPLKIIPEATAEDIRVMLINEIKSDINAQLIDFVKNHMWQDSSQMQKWEEAYRESGRYSTYYRASKINEILELAAPQIDNFAYNMTDIQKDYIMEFIAIVESTLKKNNCSLEKFNYLT